MNRIIFSLALLIACFNMSLKAQESSKIFPQDTMQKFIDKHGEDSLIKLMNVSIKSSLQFIRRDWVSMKISKETVPLLLMSKHYGLGLDTLPNDADFYFGGMLILYGNSYGDTTEVMKGYRTVIKQAEEKKMPLKDYCLDVLKVDYTTQETVIPTAQLCYLIDSDGFCGEVMNNYLKTNSKYFPLEENLSLLLYTAMVLRDDDYKNNPSTLSELKEHLESYYNSFNLTSLVMSESLFKKADNEYFSHGTLVASILNNYMMYAGIFDSPNQGRDLFYMLSLYNSRDGGFYSYRNTEKGKSDMLFTMYTVWALHQWKEHLGKD